MVGVPEELVDAVGAALDREASEPSPEVRAELLSRTRDALERWIEGSLSTSQALEALRSSE